MARRTELRLTLRKPLERSIASGHPWLYREALAPFEAEPGDVVSIRDRTGRFLGRGLAEAGPIAARVFTTRDEPLDAAFFGGRLQQAFALRHQLLPAATNAYRLVHGEGDRLPGIVVDRYAGFAVLKLDGDAALAWQARLCDWLREPLSALGISGLLVRASRKQHGDVTLAWGDRPDAELEVQEHGMRLCTSLWHGQKTGLFLDHRESRRRVRELARGLSVLNLYGYTGGFSVAAGLAGATHVTTVDSAAAALQHAEHSWVVNGLDPARHRSEAADVPELLARLREQSARFDLVIADPPNFAPTAAAKQAALASYCALHASALSLLEPGGYYLAASCSTHITRDDFELTLREGARRSRRIAQLLERSGAPADHPRLLAFPEGDYLKVTLLRAH
jgi:23S rRNA (cytosine1962-C5)-methyltransferase